MKCLAIVYFLIILLLSTTTAAQAKPQLIAKVEVEQLMRDDFSMRMLLTDKTQMPHTVKAGLRLSLHRNAGVVSFFPARPVLRVGQSLTVQLQGVSAEAVEVYPRDESIVAWRAEDGSLNALRSGETEVIFIVAQTLHILPLQVQPAPTAKTLVARVESEPELPAAPHLLAPPQPRRALSTGFFKLERAQVAYRSIEIQVVDERTTAQARYPVSGLRVSLLGSNLQLHTDARGVVRIAALPHTARLLLKLHDPQGRYVPAWQEIFVQRAQTRYRLTVRRDVSFSTMQKIAGHSQDARLASLCAVIAGEQGEAGYVVESDVAADGAYYFNQLQLLAPHQQRTGADNRFCLFNVDPGPVTLFVDDAEGRRRGAFTIGLAAGHHSEEVFTLTEGRPYRNWLAVTDDMHRPLHAQSAEGLVDFVQMRMIGDDRYLAKIDNGLLETASPAWHRGRSYAVTRDAEFEDTLYQFAAATPVGLVPLLIRGFIENIALLAQEVHDATRGSVVIEHGAQRGEDAAAVSLRLIDAEGEEVRTTWATQEGGVTRSVFLNLDYGVYQVIAQNADGYWLAAGTVAVYNETVSFLRTGAAVIHRKTP